MSQFEIRCWVGLTAGVGCAVALIGEMGTIGTSPVLIILPCSRAHPSTATSDVAYAILVFNTWMVWVNWTTRVVSRSRSVVKRCSSVMRLLKSIINNTTMTTPATKSSRRSLNLIFGNRSENFITIYRAKPMPIAFRNDAYFIGTTQVHVKKAQIRRLSPHD